MEIAGKRTRYLMTRTFLYLAVAVSLCAVTGRGHAFEGPPEPSGLADAFKGRSYSPYAARGFPSRTYWGDSHLHTAISIDAGAFGNRLGPAEAYAFAKGEEVVSATGMPAKLSRPLDWLVVADHSDAMGFFTDLYAGNPVITKHPQGKKWYAAIQQGGESAVGAALEIIGMASQGTFPEDLFAAYSPGQAPFKATWQRIVTAADFKATWQRIVTAADEANDHGQFTAFIGYEWTSLVGGNNMHRVVVYRDGAGKASQVQPMVMTPPFGSPDPRDLWRWMQDYEARTGGDVLAIAHNGNLSNGVMFPLEAQFNGVALDKVYVEQRAKWEPNYETTQIKGDGETHPLLSPEDEFADYETWDKGNLDLSQAKSDDMLAGEYAREALKRGLELEAKFGTNPYKFGLQGATDSHTSLATAQEDNFFGKHSGTEPNPDRLSHVVLASESDAYYGWEQVSSGLTAVWATENTRAALFDAMERKEVYATTGSRMMVRFFGAWDFTEQDINSRQPAFAGYEKGVPMGQSLPAKPDDASAPTFMVYALRDPIGANLDRIQIVKGWLDGDGKTHEQVYEVAWSGDREIGGDGKLPAVGNTVDVANANWTNTIGAADLGSVWTDPDSDPGQAAFYYARVIEIPTPRWSTYDAFRFGVPIPEGAPTATQERAYTSPIWYGPEG
jgi:hypothetical protein